MRQETTMSPPNPKVMIAIGITLAIAGMMFGYYVL